MPEVVNLWLNAEDLANLRAGVADQVVQARAAQAVEQLRIQAISLAVRLDNIYYDEDR